ncbi:Type 1 glutamine amidotransferase-like domain-containing protein [Solicola sp. PLA-1-18]|uniref:Type 1 glutamine amidotransferase-like domain-containing protein n=1 Tax=Solicola sp. PLA-1-18 TaxID=3380532 RepID=UPI003B81C910
MTSRVLALGGGGFSMEPDNPLLDDFCLSLVPHDRTPKVCFVPTASGDAESYVEGFESAFDGRAETSVLRLFGREVRDLRAFVAAQDVVYVGGGSTLNLLALWRLHGLDVALREAWEAGVVMAGISAGMNCWFEGSITDSWSTDLDPLPDGLGFVPGTACPHYDGEERRRPAYESAIADGFGDGHAADDGAALLFVDGVLDEVVASRPDARAYRVERGADGVTSTPLPTRYLG